MEVASLLLIIILLILIIIVSYSSLRDEGELLPGERGGEGEEGACSLPLLFLLEGREVALSLGRREGVLLLLLLLLIIINLLSILMFP